MERQINFRGYNLKNKKWIYGYYLVNRGEHFIAPDGIQPPGMTWEDFLVDPESVGQYVGTIKGVELYEGDYIEYKHTSATDDCETSITTKHRLIYNPKCGQVMMHCIDDRYTCYGDYSYLSFEDEVFNLGCEVVKYREEYKVIGNEYEKKLKISNP